MSRAKVRPEASMTHNLLHRLEVNSAHNQVRGKGMPEVMKGKVSYFCLLENRLKGPSERTNGSTIFTAENTRAVGVFFASVDACKFQDL